MLDSILAASGSITLAEILLCTAASLVMGVVITLVYMYKNTYNRSFVITLALLPVLVQSIIMLVNGNLGTGVAVMGAFSLVRFRSVPGSAREIASIFFAMALGLATGMGFVAYGALFAVVVSAAMLLYVRLGFGAESSAKSLRITIPEDTDYNGLFDDLFDQYTRDARLDKVRTTNLGSLFELQYTVTMKSDAQEKAFLDGIRMRNGNLSIISTRKDAAREETL